MSDLQNQLYQQFGGKLRIRVCGIWVEEDEILLALHRGLGPNGSLWIPPGGGVEYGESFIEALKREFLEETDVKINVDEFLFVHEFQSAPLHSLELFFKVQGDRTMVKTGIDPEMSENNQLITKVAFKTLAQLHEEPLENLHQMLRDINHPKDLFKRKGYFKFE